MFLRYHGINRHARAALFEQLEGRILFASADLSGWAGTGNTTSPNNYTVTSLTSAGGTFASRVASASSLRDDSIGTSLGYNTSFSMSGTLTFDAPVTIVDPVWFLGFYNSTNNNHRVGLAAANPTAGNNLRFQTHATNAAGSGIVYTNLANGGGSTDIADGTYDFSLAYSGSTHVMTATIDGYTANYTYLYTGAADLNRFGFLQPASTSNTATFSLSISDINYTGETQVTAPAAPSGLTATAVSPTQINLGWTDNSSNETSFVIDRATNSSFTAGLTMATVGAGVTSYSATGLTASTTYYFRVRAINTAGNSANSSTANATTQSAGPSVADLSGWVGSGNTTSSNNYTASSTSAGGTFASRVTSARYLSDDSIGSAVGYNTSFSMSGTMTFDAPATVVDPVWFFGFYNNANNNHRVGIAAANASSGNNLRFQTHATNAAGSGIVYTNLGSGGNTNIPDGTHSFNFTYSGTTHVMTATIGAYTATYTYLYTGAADLNRFGFLQPASSADSATFALSVSNINYTGETLVSGGPAAPSAPSGLGATAVSSSQINLAWTDNSSNETGFEIDRATNSGFTTGLTTTTVGANVNSYSATGLSASTTYYFRVRSTNSAGDSANTSTANATTQAAPSAPAAPSGLSATAVSTSQINLAWTDNSSNETGFAIDRATNSGFTTGLTTTTVGTNVTTYSATGLSANTTYYFRVRATNSAGDSANTSTANATTQPTGSVFYIDDTGSDSNAGTIGAPWLTMDKAIRNAPAGSTVYMRAGTYGKQTTNLTAPIRTGMVTFKPYQSEVVTFQGTSGNGFTAIEWTHVTDVRVEGLKFDTARLRPRYGDQIEIVGNDFFDGGNMFWGEGLTNSLIENNSFHDIEEGNAITIDKYNPADNLWFDNHDITIRGNTFNAMHRADGIHLEAVYDSLIDHNTIISITDSFDPGTGDVFHADGMQLIDCHDLVVTGNIIGPTARGILAHAANNAAIPSPNLTFTNNVFYGQQFGLKVLHAPNLVVVNNTFWGNASGSDRNLVLTGTLTDNVVMINNVTRSLHVGSGITFADRRNNLIDNVFGTATVLTGSGEIDATPTFVNLAEGDLRLTSSSFGRNGGVSSFSSFVALDRDGLLRDTGSGTQACDMGAYDTID